MLDFAELVVPPIFQYGFYLPQPILILILCIVYSVLYEGTQILGFGLLYFSIGYFTYKYQLLYGKWRKILVHKMFGCCAKIDIAMDHPQHSTGQAWPMICYRVFLGLLVFQVSMVGLLSLQGAVKRGLLLIPSSIFTIWAWWTFRRTFTPSMTFIALRSISESGFEAGSFSASNPTTLDEAREEGLRFENPNLTSP